MCLFFEGLSMSDYLQISDERSQSSTMSFKIKKEIHAWNKSIHEKIIWHIAKHEILINSWQKHQINYNIWICLCSEKFSFAQSGAISSMQEEMIRSCTFYWDFLQKNFCGSILVKRFKTEWKASENLNFPKCRKIQNIIEGITVTICN